VPARVVEGGPSPAVRQHQRPDALVGHVADVVEMCEDQIEALARLRDQLLVIRPSVLLLAGLVSELPVEMCGVVAEDIGDPAAVSEWRCAPAHARTDADFLWDVVPDGQRLAARP